MRGSRVAGLAVLLTALMTTSAQAADSVWWTNTSLSRGISFAALDASTSGNLPIPGGPPSIRGLAFDLAAERAYAVDPVADKLRFVKLDGTGAGEVPAPGVALQLPTAVAVDPVAGRAYISDSGADKIFFVKLDGSGGGAINTTGATSTNPSAVTVDPAAGRVYWTSSPTQATGKVSFADLDGSGGSDIVTTGATPPKSPAAIAVDPAGGRVYWGNGMSTDVSSALVGGGGGVDLNSTGAGIDFPRGLAIDAASGRLYVESAFNRISAVRLDNTGGSVVSPLTATLAGPDGLGVIKTPQSTAPPAITGTATTGSTLTCSGGTWAADVIAAFLYQTPQTLSYTWSRDNQPVAGQTAATLVAAQAGAYTCTVTAKNPAGSAQATSAPLAVAGPPTPAPPPTPTPTAKASVRIVSVSGRQVTVKAGAKGRLTIAGGEGTAKITKSVAAGQRSYTFRLTRSAANTLRQTGKVRVTFTAKLTPSGGGKAVTATRSVVIKR